jgi:hypothetical protein
MRGRRQRTSATIVIALAAILGVACSDDDNSDQSSPSATADAAPPVDPAKVVDTAAVRIAPVPEGKGAPQRSATAADARQPLPANYRESEYLMTGTAAIYDGPATGPATVESADHPFATRVLVRAPASREEFSGRVWLEPFNTTTGGDLDAVWASIAPFITQTGDAWVGVTVRAGQVERLQQFDADRYAGLDLDENAYAWDMLRAAGALLREDRADGLLPDLDVAHLYMGGYSQSAVDLATFASAFNDMTRQADGAPVYDGYLVGGRASNLSPLQSGDTIIPKFEQATMPALDVPVVDMEAQTDVEGFAVEIPTSLAQSEGVAGADEVDTPTFPYTNAGGASVRRDDSDAPDDRFRLFEIPGAPHSAGGGDGCDGSSSFPTSYFFRAAAANLAHWVEDGTAPPTAPRIELADDDKVSVAANDEYGNALGGVRSPFVDEPVARYEVHSGPAPTCKLTGNETPLSSDVLTQRYGDASGYVDAFTESLDATIDARFLLEQDRQALLDAAQERADELFTS